MASALLRFIAVMDHRGDIVESEILGPALTREIRKHELGRRCGGKPRGPVGAQLPVNSLEAIHAPLVPVFNP